MAGQTATVEVLTAEVRVLMVGSRQVTMGVYRQLDWAEAGDLEPFGRVAAEREPGDSIHVVGSCQGNLARAKASRMWVTCGSHFAGQAR